MGKTVKPKGRTEALKKITVRWNQEEENGRNRKLSSEVLKQKRMKESGSQGSALKEKS